MSDLQSNNILSTEIKEIMLQYSFCDSFLRNEILEKILSRINQFF